MSNDYQLSNGKSTTAAMTNGTTRKLRKHPWHVPYLKTCIIKDCRTKPYYDGSTHFTCCLSIRHCHVLGAAIQPEGVQKAHNGCYVKCSRGVEVQPQVVRFIRNPDSWTTCKRGRDVGLQRYRQGSFSVLVHPSICVHPTCPWLKRRSTTYEP